jgi:16S rRNA (cytosine1402-N4)-methyltransferase
MLADIIWKYGEERLSRRIARMIVQCRTRQTIESTGQLVVIIERVVGKRFLNKTLARVFQAIRIEVNNEIANLQLGLRDCIEALKTGGRIVVISYHSLEDRIVKEAFRLASADSIPSDNKIIPNTRVKPILKLLTRKPVTASKEEVIANTRARSARLRAAEKI